MTLQEVKTESVTKLINGTGDILDIKESRVTITSENKVSDANGQVYDKQARYVGSYNYDRRNGINVSVSVEDISALKMGGEVLKYIDAIENQASVVMD